MSAQSPPAYQSPIRDECSESSGTEGEDDEIILSSRPQSSTFSATPPSQACGPSPVAEQQVESKQSETVESNHSCPREIVSENDLAPFAQQVHDGHTTKTKLLNFTPTIPGLPDPYTGTVQYFIIRCNAIRNIQLSIKHGVWASTNGNNKRFMQAFNEFDHVILVFAAPSSKGWNGYARVSGWTDANLKPDLWGDFSYRLGDNFPVEWLRQSKVPFFASWIKIIN